MDLQTSVKYPTPTNSTMTVGDMEWSKFAGNSGKRPEYQTVNKYPTPCASEARQGLQIRREGKKGTQLSLSTVVKTSFPTPKTNGFCGGSGAAAKIRNNIKLTLEEKRSMLAGNGGQLNADWVEWLMGWLVGWTRSESGCNAWREMNVDPADYPGDIPRITMEKKDRCNRLKAIGNGQVPLCKAIALLTLAIAMKGYLVKKNAGLMTGVSG